MMIANHAEPIQGTRGGDRVLPPDAWAAYERFTQALGDTLKSAALRRDEISVTALLLVGTIVDGIPALLATMRSAGATYMPVIGRTMVDALVDLRLLLRSDAYLEQMRLRTFDGEARRARGLVRAFTKCGASEEKIARNRMRQQQAEEESARLLASGVKRTGKMEQRLQEASIDAALETSFYWLTSATHNDLSVLNERHMRSGQPMFWAGLPDEKKAHLLHAGGLVALVALTDLGRQVVPTCGRVYVTHLGRAGELFGVFNTFVESMDASST